MATNQSFFLTQKILKINNYYWIVSTTTNAIWKCDLSFNVIDYIIFNMEEPKVNLFRAVVNVGDDIYVFPFNAKYSYKIDTNKKTIIKLNMDISGCEDSDEKFAYAFQTNNYLIAVGRQVHGYLKYNIKTSKMDFVNNGWRNDDIYYCSFSNAVKGDTAYTVSMLNDAFIKAYDINNDIVTNYDFSEYCLNAFTTVSSDENHIYLTNDRCEEIIIDDALNVVNIKKIEGLHDKKIRFVWRKSDCCWYVGNGSGKILIKNGNEIATINVDSNNDMFNAPHYTSVEVIDDELLLQINKSDKLISFDSYGKKKEYVISISNSLKEKYLYELMELNVKHDARNVIEEKHCMSLNKFVDVISKMEKLK